MERKSDEEISLFVRDEQTGHLRFNAKALQALGIDLMQVQQRGYLLNENPDAKTSLNSTTASDIRVRAR